jgi:hypothetical protein
VKKTFVVELPLPDGLSEEEARKYVEEAVRWWSAHPDLAGTPVARLDRKAVRVKAAKE